MVAVAGDDVLEWILEHLGREAKPTDKLPKQPPLMGPKGWPMKDPPKNPPMPTTDKMPKPPPRVYPPPPRWWIIGGQIAIFTLGALWLLDQAEKPPNTPPELPGATFLGFDGDPKGAQGPLEVWQLPDGSIVKRNPVTGEIRGKGVFPEKSKKKGN